MSQEIEHDRRQEALAAVERCVDVLTQRFQVRRVIPFGSVVDPGTRNRIWIWR